MGLSPPDERYASVDAPYEAARARRDRTEERTIETGEFRTQANASDDLTFEMSGRAATLTHWSFGQLATIAGAPPNYLRTSPASIAEDALNYGLSRQHREQHQLLIDRNAPWRRWSESDSGTGGTSSTDDHAAIHAPELGGR